MFLLAVVGGGTDGEDPNGSVLRVCYEVMTLQREGEVEDG